MRNVLICASLLGSMLTFAQEKDSTNTKNIDEVIINTYIKKDSDYSNKMPLKAIEDPQVYSSIGRIALENQMVYSVDDAYRNVTGLQTMWKSTGRSGDGGAYVNLRGFIANNSLRNGLAGPVSGAIDAVNLERLEVLKGPSATLFGSLLTSYGGIINRVTKKPYSSFGGVVSLSGGSYDFYRAQADINTPLTKNKKLLFRINTAYTTEGTFQTVGRNDNFAFAPSLTYNINDRLSINVDYEMFNSRNQMNQMFFFYLPASAMGATNMKELENMGLNYKESYTGKGLYNTGRTNNLFGQVNYKISDNITSSTNASYSSSYSDGFGPYFYFSPKSATDTQLGLMRGDQSTVDSKKRYLEIQQNFNADFKIGNMRNRTVVGLDFLRVKDDQMFIFNGNFDWVPFSGADYTTMNNNTVTAEYANLMNNPNFSANNTYPTTGITNTYSAYISNVLTLIEGLNFLAAVRFDNYDFKGGKLGQRDSPAYTQSAWSPKFGLVYEIIKDKFSVFGNYQNSFKNLGYFTNVDNQNILAKPEHANQIEGGIKANLLKGKITSTISYYSIKVDNTLRQVGYLGSTALQAQEGSLTSKGVEVEINAYLVKGFSLIGGFSYNDSKFTEADKDVLGRRPTTASSPYLANFYASYQFMDGNLKGFGIGIGGNYASDNKILNSETMGIFTLPSYFVLNANAFYDVKKFRIGVKVDNFTNEHYWIGYTTANPQKLISAIGSITYKF
ncbi:TonB-dependent siderophore receptor [Chryseobacterium gossypii]|uniref:TonB-dependent siderophore receptor n=1 Tax=Chryseobacterium gossypii TaxID=3231602 RepID=UPI003525C163